MIGKLFTPGFSKANSRTALCIFLILSLAYFPLRSQDSVKYQYERFSVFLGGFLAGVNSDISLGGQSGLGLNLNLEEGLGFSTSNIVIRGGAEFNFGHRERSYVRMGYFGMFRKSNKTLETSLEIGDSIYPTGTALESQYNMQIIRAMYDYAFFKDERITLRASAGLYVLPLDFSVRIDDEIDESATVIAPLPVLGFRLTFFIIPKLIIKQDIEILYLETPSIKGFISDLNIWLEYNPFKHFGFGLGFNSFHFNFTDYESFGKRDFEGSVSTSYAGLMFYGKYYF